MSQTIEIEAIKLSLDLNNFRTVPQKNEIDAIKAMIAISRDRFYGVLESILDDGYTPTENIIVLKEGKKNVVKEGNRRIACLKIIQGQYPITNFAIPADLVKRVSALDINFKKDNASVPCILFDASEAHKADKIVSLTHGKGEKASRQKWSSVATARHNRDVNGASEAALDLLEKYLVNGNNLTNQQKERWAGEYPLTVLHEALRTVYVRVGYRTMAELVQAYPSVSNLSGIEDLLRDVGLEYLQFKGIRDSHYDFAISYGYTPLISTPSTPVLPTAPKPSSLTPTTPVPGTGSAPMPSIPTPVSPGTPAGPSTPTTLSPPAFALNDPRRVKAMLKKFNPKGNRSKVVTLRNEMHDLNMKNNPIAFCFLLRSIFEISAKSYCSDNSIPTTKTVNLKTYDLTLLETLKAAYKHLTINGTDAPVVKNLHGAMTELSKANGVLSVTSLNKLVHDPTFSITTPDICILFGNVYPLLEYMN